jgi:hypothetical protein
MKKVLPFVFIAGVSAAIFMYIKNADAGFNMFPYAFYVMLSKNPSSGGETPFIMTFDLLFSVGVAWCLYRFIVLMFFDDKKN